MTGYQSGVCNIGPRQRLGRASGAGAAFLVATGLVAAYVSGALPAVLLVVVFVPLAFGFEWTIQAYESFCVRLAVLGRYDFRPGGTGDAGRVTDPQCRRDDRLTAAKITVASLAFAAVTTYGLVTTL